MLITMLKSKIHRATVTEVNLNYVGSITIDEELLERAKILPNEKVEVFNISTGARFETYTLVGPRGSGVIGLNGAAARLALPGDKIIIVAYGIMDEEEARRFTPSVIIVDENNRPLP